MPASSPRFAALRADIVVGTRPEAIKMAPVVRALVARDDVDARLVCTGQHREMAGDVFALFELRPDANLDVLGVAGGLSGTCAAMLTGLGARFAAERPDVVLVHGDTSSTLAGAVAGFHARVPVAHVEAGLRTGDLSAPWPEEGNRKLVAAVAWRHYAPTVGARDALLAEGVAADDILVTGNTVIDALLSVTARLEAEPGLVREARAATGLPPEAFGDDPHAGAGGLSGGLAGGGHGRRLVLVTGHRRENHGRGVEDICAALVRLAARGDVAVVYPVHPNPAVSGPVRALLGDVPRVHLVEPQGYLAFIELMRRAHLVITDSGGIQEEAPALGVPVLVMRDRTERPEAVAAGTVRLVGTDPDRIVAEAARLLDDPVHRRTMSRAANPYGDGTAATRIAADLVERLPFARTPSSRTPSSGTPGDVRGPIGNDA